MDTKTCLTERILKLGLMLRGTTQILFRELPCMGSIHLNCGQIIYKKKFWAWDERRILASINQQNYAKFKRCMQVSCTHSKHSSIISQTLDISTISCRWPRMSPRQLSCGHTPCCSLDFLWCNFMQMFWWASLGPFISLKNNVCLQVKLHLILSNAVTPWNFQFQDVNRKNN
jgi:hypothetical protein